MSNDTALHSRYSPGIALLGPVFPAAPWCLHRPTVFYPCLLACLAPGLRSMSNVGRFQGNKLIYFHIFNLDASRYWVFPLFFFKWKLLIKFWFAFLWLQLKLNIFLHLLSLHHIFFPFLRLFRTCTRFVPCMSIYFVVVVVVVDLQDLLMPFLYNLWRHFQVFIGLSPFIYSSVVFIFKMWESNPDRLVRHIQIFSERM